MANSFDFSVDLIGDSTDERFVGDFSSKQRLSHRDQMQKDVLKRGLVGADAQNASQDTLVRAEMFAHLSVSLQKAPSWWRENGNGLDLFDDNVLLAVYDKVVTEQAAVIDGIKKKGEAAKEALREEKK